MNRPPPPFLVSVTVEDNIWTAECNALGLVTEAESYEKLVERTREIAPELAKVNADDIPLKFISVWKKEGWIDGPCCI